MGIARKLEGVHQDLTLLSEQWKVIGSPPNIENLERIDDLIEDIREAIMEYQVCASNYSSRSRLTFVLDFIARRDLLRQSPAHREFHPLALRPRGLTSG